MLWTLRHIVFIGVCFGCSFQAGSILAQDRVAEGRGASPEFHPQLSSIELIPNLGQLANQFGKPMPEVLYTSNKHGAKCYFTKNSMHYVFSKSVAHALACAKDWDKLKSMSGHVVPHDTLSLYRVDLHFLGANPNVTITAEDTASDYTNYYLAAYPDGITHVPAFHKIIYHDLYPHIDMVVASGNADDHYDFIVHPGGNPKQIQVRYDGQDSLLLNESGNLRVVSPFGEVTELAPASFQDERRVSSHYILRSNILSYKIGVYDHTRDLTIDPQRLWGTYFAGAGSDSTTFIQDLAVDRGGNIDIAGYTNSANIATTGAFQTTFAGGTDDGLIARFGPNGSLRWATYYGGNQTVGPPALDGNDYFQAIACDNALGMIAAGGTGSTSGIASVTPIAGFQTTFTGQQDAMLVSFDSNGTRRWATYYGGNGMEPPDPLTGNIGPSATTGSGVAIDSLGNIILIGSTMSTGGIATSGAYQTTLTPGPGSPPSFTYDLFLAKFTSGGSRLWATYFGGSGDENSGWVSADVNNNIYFTASTTSTSKIATASAFQTTAGPICFGKFSPTGTLDWATYFLHSAKGEAGRIAVDRSANIFFTASDSESGIATGGTYQTTWGGHYDGILGKFTTNGNRVWSTYYGGDSDDWLFGITLDTAANIFAGGMTSSPTRIASVGEYQTSILGPFDPFLIKLDSSGHDRYWATYYGRRGWVYGMGLDRAGHLIVGGGTQVTGINTEFSSPGAYETLPPGATNGFLAKFCDPAELTIAGTESGSVCPAIPDTLTTKPGFLTYQWYSNASPISGATSATYRFLTPIVAGRYSYTVDAGGTDQCSFVSDTLVLTVQPVPQIVGQQIYSICPGTSIKLLENVNWNGRVTYSWTPTTGLDHPDSLQPIATPSKPTVYTLAVTDTNGCRGTKQVTVSFFTPPVLSIAGGNRAVCAGSSTPLAVSLAGGSAPFTYAWSPSASLDRADSATVIATPKSNGTYYVTVTDGNGCNTKDSVVLTVTQPATITPGPALSVCRGSSIKIGAKISGGKTPYVIAWTPAATLNDSTLAQPTASPLATTVYTISVTDKNGCVAIDSVLVTVADSLTPTVTATGPLTICTGDTVHLTAGTGYKSYAWSNGDTSAELAVTKSGNYFVRVTSGGCAGTSNIVQVTVSPDSVPRPVLSASSTTICEGDSMQIELIGQYPTYRWSTGDSSSSIFVSKAGSYFVTATNTSGCSGTSAPLAITVSPKPTLGLNVGFSTRACDSLTVRVLPGYHYSWMKAGLGFSDTTDSLTITTSGDYAVTATNNAGCDSTASFVVMIVPTSKPTIGGPSSLCTGASGNYTIPSSVNGTIAWIIVPASFGTIASGQGTSSVNVQWPTAGTGTLIVTVTNADSCVGSASLPITIGDHLIPTVTPSGPLALCSGDSARLDAGAGYASYEWSRDGASIADATNETLLVDQAGNYTVFVTSAGGCSGTSAPIAITVYPLPAKPIITQNGAVLRSTPAAHYQWSFAGSLLTDSVDQTIVPNAYGVYTVTITDTNGCSNTSDPYVYTKGDTVAFAAVSVPHGMLAAPGVTVSIPLTLDSSSGLAAHGALNYVATIALDPTMLAPISPVGVMVGNRWIVSLAGLTPATPGILQTITALAADSGFCSGLTIDTFYFTGATIPITEHSGLVCLTAPCTPILHSSDTAFTIKRISPNPTEASFTIDYHVATEGPLAMELDDYLGRNVQTLKDEWSNAGDKEETYSVQTVPSGIYRLVLRSVSAQGGMRALSKILVVTK